MTLTEQWKNGKLKDGHYYIKTETGKSYVFYIDDDSYMYEDIVEILAPVPSYEEYMSLVFYKEDLTKVCKMKDKIIKKYEDIDDWWKKENQQLQELLKECKKELKPLWDEWLYDYGDKTGNNSARFLRIDDLLTKIDNAIGEK